MPRKKRKEEKIVYGTSPEMLAAHREIWDGLMDALHNPEKRIWTDTMKRQAFLCPMAHSWGSDVVTTTRKIMRNYIERGWMNEKGEWI
jgi:hypothetical protein